MEIGEKREIPGVILTIEIPPDEDPLRRLAVETIVTEFGWNHSAERTASDEVLQEELLEASDQYYGSPVYGVLANDILADAIHCGSGVIYNSSTSQYGRHYPNHRYLVQFPSRYLHLDNIPLPEHPGVNIGKELRNRIAQRGPYAPSAVRLPFQLKSESHIIASMNSYYGYQIQELLPGPITKKCLAEFVQSMQWRERRLLGSLGRAAELLSVRAGLQEKVTPSKTISRGEVFVDLKDLCAEATAAGVKRSTVRNLRDRINQTASHTLYPFNFPGDPTVIFDGETRLGDNGIRLSSIAVSSLSKIADQYTQASTAAEFIREYAKAA